VAAKRLPVRDQAPDWTLPDPPIEGILNSIAPVEQLSEHVESEHWQACAAAVANRIAGIKGACEQLNVVWANSIRCQTFVCRIQRKLFMVSLSP
jgi:hypothetical protein